MINLNKTVAVVDDDESVRRALKRLLRSAGVEAEIFSSGESLLDALSSATSSVPVCVITDFQMPGIDGLELQRRMIRTGVPIIFITGNDEPAVREKALAQGAAGFLTKPLDGAALIRALQITVGLDRLP
ncbi:response regulator transcription factor [Paraburkholderia strydomiana]|uniref:response regulator transcription factor n=1 Tax=Paraburkholderia strydomiana TaxID=1245417 RepID=UPI00285D876E|nr:response regulator [Paraburkholderia strydomiana]MDR7008981.1 FixJ family two-component response regulator [Paraburkholderia strydomiana]